MNAEQLAEWLEERVAMFVPSTPLDSHRTEVRHVLNWGGFVNHSFTINVGSRQYHLKITNKVDCVIRLRRWLEMHDVLEQRYRAPKLIDWIDFPQLGFSGLLFEHIGGSAADFCGNSDLLKAVITLAQSLHVDVELRSHLTTPNSFKTYLDYFVETYIDRFTTDLEVIEADRPAFITPSLLQWMKDETLRLQEEAGSKKAFHSHAIAPVHGDLHEGNLIVTSTDWFIVDWDDLALGDPAQEFAILVWPLVWRGQSWRQLLSGMSPDIAERMAVCFRAQLLDEVIDNVADYVDAESVPSRKAEIQRVKKLRHEEALRRLRELI